MEDVDLQGSESISSVAPEGKTLTQEEVDEIVGRERFNEREKVKRELEATHKAELEALKTGQKRALGGMTGAVDEDEIYNRVAKKFEADREAKETELAKSQRESEMKRVADNYFTKLGKGQEKYPDFEEIMGDFNHDEFPQLVFAVSEMDNAEDVMYELANNPEKLQKINAWLLQMPKRGMKELKNLSDSIKETNTAVENYIPTKAPISQAKPSNVGMDSGKMSLEDLKNADWNRF